jgi:hypothetical protein
MRPLKPKSGVTYYLLVLRWIYGELIGDGQIMQIGWYFENFINAGDNGSDEPTT